MHASSDDIDLSTLGAALRRSGVRIVLATLGAGALTYAGLSLIPPSYKSTAQIILQSSSSSLLRPSGEAVTSSDLKIDESEVASQAEVLRSHDLLATVVAAEHLERSPQFNPALEQPSVPGRLLRLFSGAPAGATPAERAVTVLAQNLRVGEVPKTRLINIDVTAQDAELAAKLANGLAAAYLDRNRNTQAQDASDATASIGGSIAKVKAEAEAAEAELERFRAQSGLLSGGNNVTLTNQQLSELNTQLAVATAARNEAEARSRILRQMIADGRVAQSQEVEKSPNMQQLFQQKLRIDHDIAELSATLLPGHPRMRQLKSELATANERLREEAAQVAAGMEDDLKVAQARETALRDSIARLTDTTLQSSDAQAKLGSLEREAQSKRTTYDGLLQRLNEASSRRSSAAVSAMASLTQRAFASSTPDSPKKTQMSVFAALAALLLGLVGVVGRALMAPGGRTAPVKTTAKASVEHGPIGAETRRLAGSQALAKFVAGMQRPHGTATRIILTGESPTQELWTAASELAGRLGPVSGGVLLLALMADRPNDTSVPGFSDLLAGNASFEQVIHRGNGQGWHVIGAGKADAASYRQSGETVAMALDALAECYSRIVIAADRETARTLLEALGGDVDAGIVCAAPSRSANAPIEDGFLGYDVSDMALAWLEAPSAPASKTLRQRSMTASSTARA